MLGLLKYFDDFSRAQGLNQLWKKGTATTAVIADNTGFTSRQKYLIQQPTAKGTFSFRIPLKHIFGFCEDYNKIVYGLKHTLTLVRKANDDDAIFRVNDVLPRENFLVYRSRQCDTITVPQATTFSWRIGVKNTPEKPRWVIIGFQTEKSGDRTKNPAIFDRKRKKYVHNAKFN